MTAQIEKESIILEKRRPGSRKMTTLRATLIFSYISIYNKLPENLKKEENRKIFKRRVTEYLCGRCLYSIDEFLEQ